MKNCKKCAIELTEETAAKKNKIQWRGVCKKCRSKDVMNWAKNNADYVNEKNERNRRKKGIGILYPCAVCFKGVKRTGKIPLCSDKCKLYHYMEKSGDCWEWSACRSKQGYGKTLSKGHHMVASRLSYEVFIGPIEEGKYVCHTCDNPSCINPSHLWTGTAKENMEDCVKKGRIRNKYTKNR